MTNLLIESCGEFTRAFVKDYWINPKNHLRMYVAPWCYKCTDGMDLRVGWGIESILYYTIDHLSVLMRMTKYQIVYLSISISVTIYYAATLFWCLWRWQWGNWCCLCQSQTNLKWFPHNIFIFTNQERKSRYIKERISLGRPQPEKYCTMCMSSPICLRRHPGKVGACSSKSDWLNHRCICAFWTGVTWWVQTAFCQISFQPILSEALTLGHIFLAVLTKMIPRWYSDGNHGNNLKS